jgi:hypothetical protein
MGPSSGIDDMKKPIILSLILLVMIGASVVYSKEKAIHRELMMLGLIPESQNFTELYLDAPPALSAARVTKGVHLNFSFTIHNLEGMGLVYPYTILISYQNGPQAELTSGEQYVADGQSATENESFVLARSAANIEVTVDLVALNQEVHFFLPNSNSEDAS